MSNFLESDHSYNASQLLCQSVGFKLAALGLTPIRNVIQNDAIRSDASSDVPKSGAKVWLLQKVCPKKSKEPNKIDSLK